MIDTSQGRVHVISDADEILAEIVRFRQEKAIEEELARREREERREKTRQRYARVFGGRS